MKCFVDTTIQNSNVHCCSKIEFNTNSVTEMLQLIAREHKDVETVHVILEEVPLDELNENEILSLVEVLKSSNFRDGHLKIICQTMSKERSVLRNGVEVSRTKSNQVDLLQSEADFKLAILSKSVRNTVAIFKLVNIAIEMLEKESNLFTLSQYEDEIVKRQSVPMKDDKTKNQSKMTSENETIASHHPSGILNDDESAKKQDSGMLNIPDNLDANLKYLDKPKSQKSSDVMKSIFHFKKNDGTSHEIDGKKPVLFFPFAGNDKHNKDKDKICLLAACFHQTFREKHILLKEHVTIIHLENEPPSLLLSSLKCLEEKAKEMSLKKYLIKRVLDVQGLEFDNVIIYIDTGEYHMRHYFVEAMTRCKANLVIIAVEKDNVHDSVISNIFKTYETKNLVRVIKIDDQNCVFNDLQNSYNNYLVKSSQENYITESDVMLRWFLASRFENKEDTRAHEPNNKVVDEVDLKVEIARRLYEWRLLGRVLGVPQSIVEGIGANYNGPFEKSLEVLKYHVEILGFEPDWSYWKRHLYYTEEMRHAFQEMELELNISTMETDKTIKAVVEEHNQNVPGVEDHQKMFELFLDYVSDRIAAVWEKLGYHLKVLPFTIEAIAVDNVQYYGTTKKARAMLRCARNSSDGLSWQRLKAGLSYCNRWDIIRDIEARQEFRTIVNGDQ